MVTLRKRWRLRTIMVLIALAALALACLRKAPDRGPLDRLKYGDSQERMSAAVQLGYLGAQKAKSAEPALLAALSDSDQGVCDCAAWALNAFGSTSPALVKALVKQVEVETAQSLKWRWMGDFYMRVDPFEALTRIKPHASTLAPLLGKAMSSADPWIRRRAVTLLRDALVWSGGSSASVSPYLLAALRDREPGIRLLIVDDLTKLDGATRRTAVAILLERLRSPDPPDALEATVCLAKFGLDAEPAATILADRLPTGDLADRFRTLFLLGKLGTLAKAAVPAIVQAMAADDAGARKPDFLNAFWRPRPTCDPGDPGITIGSENRGDAFKPLRDYGVLVLGRIDREAERQGIGVFVKMLGAETVEGRRAALESLADLGSKAQSALPTLITMAERIDAAPADTDDASLVFPIFRAIQEVGSGDDRVLVDALVRMLVSCNGDRRWGAAMALGHLRPPPKGAVPTLVEALNDPQPVVRRYAVEALGRYDGSEGETLLQVLLDATRDPDFWVRVHAGRALASRGEAAAEAIPSVIRLLRTEDRNLRSEAATVLGKFGPSAQGAIAALLVALDDEKDYVRNSAEAALKAVSPIESRTAEEALEALREGDPVQRQAAICDLVRPGSAAQKEVDSSALVGSLRVALGDPAPNVRATAAAALGRLGDQAKGATPALLVAMRDETRDVRVLAATALGRVASGNAVAIEALGLALAEDRSVDVRNAAASGLGRMGPQAAAAAPLMIRALNTRNGTVRVHVIVALGRIGPADGSVARALTRIAEEDPSADLRIWAIRALGLIGAKSVLVVPTLLKMLDDPDESIRNSAAYQLGEIRPTMAVLPALLALLDDGKPSMRALASGTIGMLGPEVAAQALPALIRALRDPDERVRRGALTSLMEFGRASAPAEPALRQTLNDPCPAVRSDGELALKCALGEAGVGIIRSGSW